MNSSEPEPFQSRSGLLLALPFVRIAFGAMFMASAVLKLFPIEYFELILVDQVGVSWGLVPYFSRGLVLLEAGLGLALIFGFYLRWSLWFSLTLLAFFQVFLFVQLGLGNADADCGCFGELIPMDGPASIMKNFAFLILGGLLSWKLSAANKKVLPWLAPALFVLAVPLILFAYPTPEFEPNADFELDIELLQRLQFDQGVSPLVKGDKTVVVMLSNCIHCAQLGALIAQLDPIEVQENLRIVVVGKPAAIDFFVNETAISGYEYARTEDRELIGAIDGTFPTVLQLEEGVVTKKWKGQDVNISLLTDLLQLQ